MSKKRINEIGNRYGNLVVIGSSSKGSSKDIHWLCQCDCGETKAISGHNLRKGNTKSCGCKEGNIKESGSASSRQLFSSYKYRARKKKLEWTLSYEDFMKLTSATCFYCGISPEYINKPYKLNGGYLYNGIDRIDNTKGYIMDNCVSCCFVCNRAKNSMPLFQFNQWLNRLVAYYISK